MSANPFIVGDKSTWKTNELLLNDPQLRRKAGVNTLDTALREMTSKRGGAAFGAPFYSPRATWDGPVGNTPYSTAHPVNSQIDDRLVSLKFEPTPVQSGGFPAKYFNPDAKW
jgi:hypothetical protein